MSNTPSPLRRRFLGTAAGLGAAVGLGMAMPANSQLPIEGDLPSLGGANAWLNSTPLQSAGLRGKVVLVNFWTYTCINWLRSLPYLRAWANAYRSHGLVVIGIHTPEFAFEKRIENVRRAIEEMRINYPVAQDNNYTLWRDFHNEYWPASYLIDAQSRIRHHQFGEGGYDQTEIAIQQLLAAAGTLQTSLGAALVESAGPEAPADWRHLKSPENYLGSDRTANRDRAESMPLKLNHWSASGEWKMRRDAIALSRPNGRITYRFHARDLHVVMGPAIPGTAVRFRVRLNGQPPAEAHGTDIDSLGNGIANAQRLYQLIRQPGPIEDRQFEIEFLDPNVEAFAFTFG